MLIATNFTKKMKHSFKLKKSQLKTVFYEKLEINSISIENKSDVYDAIDILLNFIELEHFLKPRDCGYNFINNQVTFQLELDDSKSKKDFFEAIKKFDDYFK